MSEELIPGAEWTTVFRQTSPRRRVAALSCGAVPGYEWWEGSLFLRFVGFDRGSTTDDSSQLFRVPKVWIPTLMRRLRLPLRNSLANISASVDTPQAAVHLHHILRGAPWVLTRNSRESWHGWEAGGASIDAPVGLYPERLPTPAVRRAVLRNELCRGFAASHEYFPAVERAYDSACRKIAGPTLLTPRVCRWAYPEIAVNDWDDDTCDDPDFGTDADDDDVLSFAGVVQQISLERGAHVASFGLKGCDAWVVEGNISYGIAPATIEGRMAMLRLFADELGITTLDECDYSGLDRGLEARLRAWLDAECHE